MRAIERRVRTPLLPSASPKPAWPAEVTSRLFIARSPI